MPAWLELGLELELLPRTEVFGPPRRFVAEVVAPAVGDPAGVVFQCPPTLRVVLPSARPTGKPHRDADYVGHEPPEINFWVPVRRSAVHRNAASSGWGCAID